MRDLPPNDAIAAATFFSSFSLRASKRSSPAPANAISLAIAAPTPLDAPVTRTVLPLISMRVLPGSFPLRPNGLCPLWVKLRLRRKHPYVSFHHKTTFPGSSPRVHFTLESGHPWIYEYTSLVPIDTAAPTMSRPPPH